MKTKLWLDNTAFHRKTLVFSVIFYAIAIIFSVGYFHADEHYQIIEFAGILNGSNQSKDMVWEYSDHIRSAFQPTIAYYIFKACDFFSVSDPYVKAFVLRLITGILSLSVIYHFVKSCEKIVSPQYWNLFVLLSNFLWFLPFLNIRFSSETWSGILLLLAISLVIRNNGNTFTYLLIGTLLGFSFLCRFQISFAIGGLIAWLLFIKKESIKNIVFILTPFFLIVVLGIFIDSWYYGKWTFTMINYFVTNIVAGKAASFGTSPWYFYFFYVFRYSFFPIGIVLLASLIIVVTKRHKNLVVWIILPFFIGHSLIPHKELRFLFPLINLLPLLIVTALEIVDIPNWNNYAKKSVYVFFTIVAAINICCLIVSCIIPAGTGGVKIAQKIHHLNTRDKLNVIHSKDDNVYAPWGLTTNFYKEPNATFIESESLTSTSNITTNLNTRTVLIVSKKHMEDPNIQGIISKLNMKEVSKSIPDVLLPIWKLYGESDESILTLFVADSTI